MPVLTVLFTIASEYPYGTPLPKAIRLLKTLCLADKELAKILVKKGVLDACKRLLFSLPDPSSKSGLELRSSRSPHHLWVESIRFWRVCTLYSLDTPLVPELLTFMVQQIYKTNLYEAREEAKQRLGACLALMEGLCVAQPNAVSVLDLLTPALWVINNININIENGDQQTTTDNTTNDNITTNDQPMGNANGHTNNTITTESGVWGLNAVGNAFHLAAVFLEKIGISPEEQRNKATLATVVLQELSKHYALVSKLMGCN